MKKSILALFALMIALVACEGPAGPPGRDGLDGTGMNWRTEFYTIGENEWEIQDDGGGPYFYCEREIPQISEDIYEYKHVFAYMFIYDTGYEEQTPLPYPVPYKDSSDRWVEFYSYTYAPGLITFFVRYDDFNITLPPRGDKEYKVVLNW